MTQNRRGFIGAAGAAFALASNSALAAERVGGVRRLDPALDAAVDVKAPITEIARGYRWAEGPIWVPSLKSLLFSDVPSNVAYRWQAASGAKEFLKPSGFAGADASALREAGSNGLKLAPDGALLICDSGDRCVSRLDLKTRKRTVLTDHFQGRRYNSPNDLIVARSGAYYFTDPPYGLAGMEKSPARELAFAGVFRLAPDGGVQLIDDSLSFPNGVALSPDQRTLYVSVSDPKGPVIRAYALGPDGLPTASRLFFDAAPLTGEKVTGLPDGMCVDEHGRLFCAGPGGLMVISPEGKLLGVIEGGRTISNCAFGEDGHTLFMTASDRVLRTRVRTRGLAWAARRQA